MILTSSYLRESYPIPEGWEPPLEQQAEELLSGVGHAYVLVKTVATVLLGAGKQHPDLIQTFRKLEDVRDYVRDLLKRIESGTELGAQGLKRVDVEIAALGAYLRELREQGSKQIAAVLRFEDEPGSASDRSPDETQ